MNACKLPRVVEKSSKDRPVWIHGIRKDALIVEGIGKNHEEAQEDALRKIRQRIVSSVAVNIFSETNINVTEQIIDNMSRYTQNSDYRTRVSTDFFNSIRGISLIKVSEFYWEKIKTDKDKYEIHYHVVYPLDNSELEKLISEWEKTDKSFGDELSALESDLVKTDDFYEILAIKKRADALAEIFIGTRKARAQILATNAQSYINNLRLEIIKNERGYVILSLKSQNKILKMISEIKFQSDCAYLLNKQLVKDDKNLEIFYEPDDCNSPENNYLNITQVYSGVVVDIKLNVPVSENYVRFQVLQPVRLREYTDDFLYKNIEWFIPLKIYTENEFIISKVELSVLSDNKLSLKKLIGADAKQEFFVFDEQIYIDGKGEKTISLKSSKSYSINDFFKSFSAETSSFYVSGKVYYIPKGDITAKVYEFYNYRLVKIK